MRGRKLAKTSSRDDSVLLVQSVDVLLLAFRELSERRCCAHPGESKHHPEHLAHAFVPMLQRTLRARAEQTAQDIEKRYPAVVGTECAAGIRAAMCAPCGPDAGSYFRSASNQASLCTSFCDNLFSLCSQVTRSTAHSTQHAAHST